MNKRKLKQQHDEKQIILVSFWTGIAFVAAETLMAIYSSSQSVLTDSVFDAIESVVIALTIFIIPLIYKPINEKHPFGYAQLESVFILLKGFMFIAVMIMLIINNITIMLQGGNHVNHLQVSFFETILTICSIIVLLILKHLNQQVSSPLVDTEIYGWKIDVYGSIGVSLAFFISSFLTGTPLAFINPYFDQIVAIVLAALMLPEPIKLVIKAFRDLVLFAPSVDISEDIKDKCNQVLKQYDYDPVFYDITRTGRKYWISIYFTTRVDTMSFTELELANRELYNALKHEYEDCFVELIPNVLANK